MTAANLFTKDMYILELTKNIQRDASALEGLVSAFKEEHSDVAENMTAVNLDIAASSIAAKRVVNRVLQLRNKFDKEVKDYAVHQCVSCNILFRRSAVTKVSFSDNLGNVWPDFKAHIMKGDPEAEEKTLFMCRVCKNALKKNKMASKCRSKRSPS